MMGVYIKGATMPKEGTEKIIRIQPDGTVLDQYGHHLAITAVPVPPHGRLIDADALLKEMSEENGAWAEDMNDYWIGEQPTIIDAEG